MKHLVSSWFTPRASSTILSTLATSLSLVVGLLAMQSALVFGIEQQGNDEVKPAPDQRTTRGGAHTEGQRIPSVEVLGLFKNAAMLSIDGQQRLLKVQGEPVAGIRLISADSKSAIIEFRKQQRILTLSNRVSSVFKEPESITVSIQLNAKKQYRTTGVINGSPVSLVVDTGATIVALNSTMAEQMGIDYESGVPSQAITAGGRVKSWQIVLPRVQVGGILRENVAAAVLEGDYPMDILLGMTFLSQVSINEVNGILVLTSKY